MTELLPALAEHGVRIVDHTEVARARRAELTERYRRQIFPVLTPLAVGLGRPFPYISNLSLSLVVLVRDPVTDHARSPGSRCPRRSCRASWRSTARGRDRVFIPLEDVIAANLDALFPGMEIVGHALFRVTRDADFEVSDEADDLLRAVEDELRRRRFGEVVRLEVEAGMDRELRRYLTEALEVEERQVYDVEGLLDLEDLWQIVGLDGPTSCATRRGRRSPSRACRTRTASRPTCSRSMRAGDVLVHHPYESFATSVERFVNAGGRRPERAGHQDDRVPHQRRLAARAVADPRRREGQAGGLPGRAQGALRRAQQHPLGAGAGGGGRARRPRLPALKTHAKAILVVRRERDGVRHYVHVGTGNFHAKTARLYKDFGLFTDDERDRRGRRRPVQLPDRLRRPRHYRKVLVAPGALRDRILEEIERTIAAAEDGGRTRIRMKMNSLVDRRCIRALYRASQAGVPIELNIRGICCLRPGVPGLSESIRVVSVVGRFLEHSRIYSFQRGDEHAS